MNIYADDTGVSLVFKDEADLQKTIENLQGMLVFKKENPGEWPGAYTTFHDAVPEADADAHAARAVGDA